MPVEVETIRAVEVPTRLVHGAGAVSRLADLVHELGVTKPLLVTDPGVAAAGLSDRALDQLPDAIVFDRVRPNPDIALVDEGAALYAESECDGLVAVGGGSSMDTAKSIGVVAAHGGSIARLRVGTRPDHVARPAARRDPHDGRDGQRGDALGRHHRPRPQDQVQRRRDAPHRAARRAHRPRAHARPPARRDGGDRDGRSLTRDRVLHVRLPPAVQRRRRAAGDRARRALAAGRRRGRLRISRRGRRWRTPRPSAAWPTAPRAPAPRTP